MKESMIDPGYGDHYWMVFPGSMHCLDSLNGVVPVRVLFCLMSRVEFNTGHISLNSSRKGVLLSELGMSDQMFSRAIRILCRDNIMSPVMYVDRRTGEERISRGDYMVNPAFFWRGLLRSRNKVLEEYCSVRSSYEFNVLKK